MDILKLRFFRSGLLNYVFCPYPAKAGVVFLQNPTSYSYPRICRGITSCGARHATGASHLMYNFPGPEVFCIPFKKYATLSEFIEAYVFDMDNNYVTLHFDLDAREFLTE